MNLDDELRSALRRREPPPGFTGRVLRSLAAAGSRPPGWRERLATLFPQTRLRWAAVSVALGVLLVSSGAGYRRHRQGELAKEQVVTALRIAGERLSYGQKKALEINSIRRERAGQPSAGSESQ